MRRSALAAMALRRRAAPWLGAYWLMSREIASWAASFSQSGAVKSGKPWERLTALCSAARRLISENTETPFGGTRRAIRVRSLGERWTDWDMTVVAPTFGWQVCGTL